MVNLLNHSSIQLSVLVRCWRVFACFSASISGPPRVQGQHLQQSVPLCSPASPSKPLQVRDAGTFLFLPEVSTEGLLTNQDSYSLLTEP